MKASPSWLLGLGAIVFTVWVYEPQAEAQCSGTVQVVRWEVCPHQVSCYDGQEWRFDPRHDVYYDSMDCETGEVTLATGWVAEHQITSGPCQVNAHTVQRPPGTIIGSCPTSCVPIEDAWCDGSEADDGTLQVDDGCQDGTCSDLDKDEYPIRYSSGRVEINPVTVFAANAPDGIFFGLTLKWGSHELRRAGVFESGGSGPDIDGPLEHTHYYGAGWSDNYSDRLIEVSDGRIVWRSMSRWVTFWAIDNDDYESADGDYQLHKVDADTTVVSRKAQPGTTTQTWTFEEVSYGGYGASEVSRIEVPGYALTIQRDNGKVTQVTDTWGRALVFTHSQLATNAPWYVTGVELRQGTGSLGEVAAFRYAHGQLDAASFAGTYRRFTYYTPEQVGLGTLTFGQPILHEVITPNLPGALPGRGAPPATHEAVTEGHEYDLVTIETENGPHDEFRAVESYGLNRHWAYEYDEEDGVTTQFDLLQPGAGCSGASCASGYYCLESAATCYVATHHYWDPDHRQIEGQLGNDAQVVSTVFYPDTRRLKAIKDKVGVWTTYAYDANGNVFCMVRGDDDQEAAVDSSDPSSACDPPAVGGQVTRIETDYAARTQTKLIPSVLQAGAFLEMFEAWDADGRVTERSTTGFTRSVDGVLGSETRSTTYQYGTDPTLLVRVDGPRDNSVAYDVVDYTYWEPGDPGYVELAHKRPRTVTRYVGTASAYSALTTEYSNYDIRGVARRVREYVLGSTTTVSRTIRLTTANDLDWTITVDGAGGTPSVTSEVHLNPDGTVRYAVDPDGVCTTYQYSDTYGATTIQTQPPSVIKRSKAGSAGCGVLPIVETTGDVEVRTYEYVAGEGRIAPKLTSVQRFLEGSLRYSVSGFVYDAERRVTQLDTPHSGSNYLMTYVDGMLSATQSPGWPASDAWKSGVEIDAHGRPTRLSRHQSAGGALTNDLGYASVWNALPTTLTRGLNGANASTTTFVYDDFGQLIETVSPDHGTVRWQYDAASNPIKERFGVGTALVRTSHTTYDSLGRVTFVDNDLEHPVSCSSNPGLMTDEEFRYDDCGTDVPPGFTCTNGSGRLVMARVITTCSGTSPTKDGRWYAYDGLGRVERVGFATLTGTSTWSDVHVTGMTYAYTAGSRIAAIGNPRSAWSTNYGYESSSRPWNLATVTATKAGTPGSVSIASNIAYQPFGPITFFRTGQTLTSPNREVRFSATLNPDYSLATHRWYNRTTSGFPVETDYMNQSFTYNGAGLPVTRADTAVHTNRRFYAYDSLMRLTCEAKGDGTTAPTSADCNAGSARRMGLFTYTTGSGPTEPPDNRKTANLNMPNYAKVDTYAYAGGSNKVTGIAHTGGGSIVTGHDALGRRTYDFDSAAPTLSRRDYTYLPNGQLGSISGRKPDNTPYTEAFRYDTEGRLVLMTRTKGSPIAQQDGNWRLYWDDADRLVAAVYVLLPTTIVWSYHYLDGHQPLAATREVTVNNSTTTARFWFVADERGLIHRALDTSGAEAFTASYAASGWRTVTNQQTNMWVPFLLPGQVVADGTAAHTAASGGQTRPEIAVNRLRPYDPSMGRFTMPDGMDTRSRRRPEGFEYARSNPVANHDASGRYSDSYGKWSEVIDSYADATLDFEPSCLVDSAMLSAAVAFAYAKVAACDVDGCKSFAKQAWLNEIASGRWACPGSRIGTMGDSRDSHLYAMRYIPLPNGQLWSLYYSLTVAGAALHDGLGTRITLISQMRLGMSLECIANTVAHESLHPVVNRYPVSDLLGSIPLFGMNDLTLPEIRDHINSPIKDPPHWFINNVVGNCVGCK